MAAEAVLRRLWIGKTTTGCSKRRGRSSSLGSAVVDGSLAMVLSGVEGGGLVGICVAVQKSPIEYEAVRCSNHARLHTSGAP